MLIFIIVNVTPSRPLILLCYPTENQILFRNLGTVVNKLTYLHIRYVVDFSILEDTVQQSISIACKCKEKEMKRKNI